MDCAQPAFANIVLLFLLCEMEGRVSGDATHGRTLLII